MQVYEGVIGDRPWAGYRVENSADLDRFREWVTAQREPVAVDTETRGLRILSAPNYVRLVQFGNQDEAWVIPVERGPVFVDAVRWAMGVLPRLIGHNAPFDALALWKFAGLDLDMMMRKWGDTQVRAKLVDPRKDFEGGIGSGLKQNSAWYLDPNAPDTQAGLHAVFRSYGYTKKSGLGWSGVPLEDEVYNTYAALDTILTSRLLVALDARLAELSVPRSLVEYEQELNRICAHMQRSGLLLDQEYAKKLCDDLGVEAEHHARLAAEWGVEKVGAPKQIAEALIAMGETLTERTATGSWKVDKPVLLQLADLTPDWKRIGAREPNPLADAVIRSKRAGKWRSSYGEKFLEFVTPEGRIHPNINTMEARTGRMSITGALAAQTLPSSDWMVRRALLADEGHVMCSVDFAAIEMRVLAALADVKNMKRAILDGDDLHDFTRQLVFGDEPDEGKRKKQRKLCKGVGFGKVYGGGANGISRLTGAPLGDVQRAIQGYDRAYPEIRAASSRWQQRAMNSGMVAVSLTGRRLPLDRDRTYAVTNYLVQSLARDCLGQSLIHMDEAGLLPYLRLPVHDEVVASVPREDAKEIGHEIAKCMTWDLLGVPIEAEAEIGGRSWGSLYGADF